MLQQRCHLEYVGKKAEALTSLGFMLLLPFGCCQVYCLLTQHLALQLPTRHSVSYACCIILIIYM
jgi:hypothetical protein